MSEHDVEPLAQDLADLLRDEAAAPPMPADLRARVRQRVLQTAGNPGADGASPSGSAGSAGGSSSGTSWFARRLPFGLTTFVLGVVVGAAGLAALRPLPAPRVITVTREVPVARAADHAEHLTSATTTAIAPAAVTPAPARDVEAPAATATTPSPSVTTVSPPRAARDAGTYSRDTMLAAERALLEVASGALARDQAQAALEAVERHARRFPDGQLSEERESVWIQSLARLGRSGEARQRAARFRQRYPRSILLPVVEETLRSIP